MECPLCHRSKIGQIGMHRYFCSHCYIEFEVDVDQELRVYDIMDDGTLRIREEECMENGQ